MMDKRPFVEWVVLGEEPPPYDFLTLMQKAQYNPELMSFCCGSDFGVVGGRPGLNKKGTSLSFG